MDYPFFPLDPDYAVIPAFRWWTRKLRALTAIFEVRMLAQHILSVEWYPYRSISFGAAPRLASQHYSFHLVRQALARGATIILMRSEGRWMESVPELLAYPRLYRVRSWQNLAISAKNCPDGWPEIIATLKRQGSATPV